MSLDQQQTRTQMTPAKKRSVRKTKPTYVASRKTLDMQHAENLSVHIKRRERASSMTVEIDLLQARLNEQELDVSTSIDIRDRLAELRIGLKAVAVESDEVQYFTDTAGILFRYYSLIDAESTATNETPNVKDKNSQQQQPKAASRKAQESPPEKKQNSILKYFGMPEKAVATTTTTKNVVTKKHNAVGVIEEEEVEEEEEVQQRGSLLDHFMECTNRGHVKKHLVGDPNLVCHHCNSEDRTMMSNDGYVLCNACHMIEYVVVDHEKPSYKDPPKEISYYAYKRLNHFNEWLNQVQGKETTDIPDEVFDRILLEIKKQKVENIANLTHAGVRKILKRIRIGKYYEHSVYILTRLNGITIPHLPPELEETFRNMFKQIQVPFSKHSPMSRKNFLSYSFVLHKMSQLLGHDQYLGNFPLLKSREKLQQQDQIWCKICKDLNWEFIKSL
jgi:hypothetical protein